MTPEAAGAHVHRFTCKLPNGLHVRPASELARIAARFAADVRLHNLRNGSNANVKSTLALLASGTRYDDECELRAAGEDAEQALAALAGALQTDLPRAEVAYTTAPPISKSLPRALRGSGSHIVVGVGVSRGIARGHVVHAGEQLPDPASFPAGSRTEEQRQLADGLQQLERRLAERVASSGDTEASLLRAQEQMLRDPALLDSIGESISRGESAGTAIVRIIGRFVHRLRNSEATLVRERAADLVGIALELLRSIYGDHLQLKSLSLTQGSVVIAEELAPQQLLDFDRTLLRGLVLEAAASTSHAVIVAKSLGIPAVVAARGAREALAAGEEVIVDGSRGLVAIAAEAAGFYAPEIVAEERRAERLRQSAMAPATTADGVALEVAANISSAAEGAAAFSFGADGVGVFRTEFLFSGRESPPSEEEQFAAYRQVVNAAADKPVIFRTFDVGGDKPIAYIHSLRESNPFLGVRGARLYRDNVELLKAQLRAMLRAAAYGPVSIMAPMIANAEEAAEFRAQVTAVRDELAARGVRVPEVKVGVMVEVPSAAYAIEHLAQHVEFFSIGTNDLAQYFFAADRGNAAVAGLGCARHPAFLKLLAQICQAAKRAGKWIGNCGDMAADARNLPLLVGAGFDEIGVPPNMIGGVKEQLRSLSAEKCRAFFAQALQLKSASEVEELIRSSDVCGPVPLLDPELVMVGAGGPTKEDALRRIALGVYAAGRTEDPDEIEEALWRREELSETAVTPGFAIPHCRSAAVRSASMVVLRPAQPIPWSDGNQVHSVIGLLLPASAAADEHLRVLAKLARRLMDDEFRASFTRLQSAQEVVTFLGQELGL